MTDFHSVWLKLDRAKQHIDDLEAVIATHDRLNPYHIVVEDNSQTGKRVAKIGREPAPIPNAVPLILGDAVHAIRSSLDHFAYAADPAQIGKTNTAFPIWRSGTIPSRKELKSLIGRKIGHASESLKKALLDLQPYKGGHGEQFWLIDYLDDEFEKYENLKFAVGVAFGEPQVLVGEPVVPTLRRLLDEVDGLLQRLIPLT